jgi:heptosyltransferase-2
MFCGLLDALCNRPFQLARAWTGRRDDSKPQSILIVQLDHIGDAVLSTPMIRAIHEHFPDSVIDVLASQSNREVFEANTHVRRVHVSQCNWLARGAASQSYLVEALRLARQMRPFGYDLGIDPRGDFLVALVLWLAGIPRRLGWTCGGGGFLFTDVARWGASRHEVESRRALLEPLGIRSACTQPVLTPSWADNYHVRELLATIPEINSPLVVVHVGAGTQAKRWPITHLVDLVNRMVRERACAVILIGGPVDESVGRTLARLCPAVIDWTGSLSLMQVAALLGEADLFIGGDSGPAHVAAAMGTPSVVLFSGTNRVECWRPLGQEVHVLRRAVPCSPCHMNVCPIAGHPCMSEISPAEVFDTARQIVKDSTRRQRCALPASAIELEVDLDQSA